MLANNEKGNYRVDYELTESPWRYIISHLPCISLVCMYTFDNAFIVNNVLIMLTLIELS